MIRTAKVLFCDNEHGAGDVTYPDLERLNERDFIQPRGIRTLRAEAKKAGWSRHNGADYCDICTESGI